MPPRLYSTAEVASEVGYSMNYLNVLRWRNKGSFPVPSYRVGRNLAWSARDIERIRKWLDGR
jgi:hypothetical protein